MVRALRPLGLGWTLMPGSAAIPDFDDAGSSRPLEGFVVASHGRLLRDGPTRGHRVT